MVPDSSRRTYTVPISDASASSAPQSPGYDDKAGSCQRQQTIHVLVGYKYCAHDVVSVVQAYLCCFNPINKQKNIGKTLKQVATGI